MIKSIVIRFFKLYLGLFLFAVGIVFTINAGLGLSPWDVFNSGLSKTFNITIGQANIYVGLVILIINIFFKEKIGYGTISNMIFIGIFIDLLMIYKLIPVFDGFILRILMLLAGMIIIGFASFLYISTGFGSGPRDGLMIVLTRLTNRPVSIVRSSMESAVVIIGYFLGGNVGIGTLISAITIGHIVQLVFKLLNFDVSRVKHRYIDEDYRFVKNLILLKTFRKS
ncbi:MAG: YitT family protein [Clostridiaceae bacterium]